MPNPANVRIDMTAPDGLLRDAGGARPTSDVDALIKRITCARWKAEAEVTRIRAARDALTVKFRKVEVLWKEAAIDASRIEAERDALRQKLDGILKAYDAYRGRGMLPAPNQYALLVAAIDAAREKPSPRWRKSRNDLR